MTNPFTENLYFGKIDVEPTQNDRIEVTGNLRLEHNVTGGNGQIAASTSVPYRNNVKRGDASGSTRATTGSTPSVFLPGHGVVGSGDQ